ncbi:MAG: hypothetical protein BMS9Abin23_0376 [Thermodesulfobacteriota bacterium]|nr:MAG: hypothetical protein BMS9Abin23_0376 [Thermodesulfobacteriota bacterium]
MDVFFGARGRLKKFLTCQKKTKSINFKNRNISIKKHRPDYTPQTMLKTECPHCSCSVYSPLLTESEDTDCPSCGKPFTVKEVFISAGPYSIYRDVLLKNMGKYLRLLREAKEEVDSIKKKGEGSRAYAESAKTVDLFIDRLKELLDGCRSKLRVTGEDISVEYMLYKTLHKGKLVNISSTGICIHVGEDAVGLNRGQSLNLNIKDPMMAEPLYVEGEVVWVSGEHSMGVRFINMDEGRKKILHDLILEKSLSETD